MTGYSGSSITSYIEDVDKLFDNCKNVLREEKWTATETIDAWAQTLRFQIDGHVKEQKSLLECYYTDRQRVLSEKKQEIIDEMYKLNRQYEYTKARELLELCKTLKFELLVAFDYEKKILSFIQCTTKEQLAQKRKTGYETMQTGSYRSESKLNLKNSKDFELHPNLYNDPPCDSTRTDEQINDLLLTTNSTNNYSRSKSGDDNEKYQDIDDHTSDTKCPVCFMLFPSHMARVDRDKHTIEHYS